MANSAPKCPECGGLGVVVLLSSSRPCRTCAEARKVASDAGGEAAVKQVKFVNSHLLSMSYDARGRLISTMIEGAAGDFAYTFDKP